MNKIKVKNIVFTSGGVNVHSGGPSGYIANLKNGIEQIGYNNIKFIFRKSENIKYKSKLRVLKFASFWIPCKKIRKKFRNRELGLYFKI